MFFNTLTVAFKLMAVAVIVLATAVSVSCREVRTPEPVGIDAKDTIVVTDKVKAKDDTIKKVEMPSTTEAPDPTVRGTLTDEDGRPVSGVVVSDGYSCTLTNDSGHYIFLRDKKARFVWYCVPDSFEIPVLSDSVNTAMFYEKLAAKRNVYNFTLHRLPGGKERRFQLLIFGDPQITNAINPYYTSDDDNPIEKSDVQRFTEETMTDVRQTIATWPASMPVYAISMGDDVQYYGGYNASLESQIRDALGSSRAKVFSVIGNHDQDGKDLYKRKWEENFGPTDYSFDRGDIHFVCFNNVRFIKNTSYYSPGELTAEQMEWLREDLKLADHNKKVILSYHIPFTFGKTPAKGADVLNVDTEPGHYTSSVLSDILRELEQFGGGYEMFCGHTHFAINHEIEYEGRHLMEHCHAAACGNIWQSNINICGTPNGYYVYEMDSTRIANNYYKSTFWPRTQQMTLFAADSLFNGESYAADWQLPADKGIIVANVFNADSRWRVVAIENGKEHEMQRLSHTGQDAFSAGYHHKYAKATSYSFISKSNGYLIMNHLYYYVPTSTDNGLPHIITIKATDPYGNVYTATSADVVTEPYYNYAHFYKNSQDSRRPQ